MATKTSKQGMAGLVDHASGAISREIFVNRDIYEEELEKVFARSWLLVGHESLVPKPGDYFQSSMGEESVILARDRSGQLHVFLNSCRHRGMKVCRYDEGNAAIFTCPYHGWSYGLDGGLVGVPYFKDAYFEKLDKSKWGLAEVAQMCNYKGTIWACWDKDAPRFEDYMGGMLKYLDAVVDARDGSDGESEVLGGIWKWKFPSNWKFGAENFCGDHYHAISHRSEILVGTGLGGPGTERHGVSGGAKRSGIRGNVAFTRLGHCSGGGPPFLGGTNYFPAVPSNPVVDEYFKSVGAKRDKNLGKKLYAPSATGTIFPNASFHGWFPRGFAVWHPRGPMGTEAWRFYLVDKDAPEEVKEHLRHYYMQYGGPTGMTEQDDMENWNYATEASAGTIARRFPYNYEMGMGEEYPIEGLEDAVFSPFINEQNPRWYYKRWAELMDANSWNDLFPNKRD